MTEQFKTYFAGEDGFSEWVSPKHGSYLMKCCDCGLVHEMQFQVVRFIGEPNENGDTYCKPVKNNDIQALFRVRLHDEELHYLKAKGVIDFSAGSEARYIIERVENEEISASKACELICELSRKA